MIWRLWALTSDHTFCTARTGVQNGAERGMRSYTAGLEEIFRRLHEGSRRGEARQRWSGRGWWNRRPDLIV